MLQHVEISNFQSIREADLALGKFTVVVGASNSGKSAFLRAVRTAVVNAPGSTFVTRGRKAARVHLRFEDADVELERGASLATFTLNGQTYAKSGRSVPDDVRDAVRMSEVEGEILNFAFQFDRPFLLDETATKVAKVLGDLTNINLLYEAVREAARRSRADNQRLKVRREDLDRSLDTLQAYRDLPKRKEALASVREAFQRLEEETRVYEAMKDALVNLERNGRKLRELQAEHEESSIDLTGVESDAKALSELQGCIGRLQKNEMLLAQRKGELQTIETELVALDHTYHETLAEAGTCPVCGQEVKDVGQVRSLSHN